MFNCDLKAQKNWKFVNCGLDVRCAKACTYVCKPTTMSKLGGAPRCSRCDKAVYFAEEVVAGGKKWHKSCLRCSNDKCKKSLDSFNLTEHDGSIYCKNCYTSLFGAKGYGFAGGAAGLAAETRDSSNNGSYQIKRPSVSSLGNGPRCPRCDQTVYFAEEMMAIGKKWHKACLKCAGCNKNIDSTSLTEHDGEIFCKSCYGKNFGPKGYGFAGGAAGLAREEAYSPLATSQGSNAPEMSSARHNGGSTGSYQPKRPSMGSLGKGPRCPRCGEAVYFAEEMMAIGKKWHKSCLKCVDCNKKIDSTSLTEHDGEIFCKSCYGKHFGPKGYGFAGGAAGLAREEVSSPPATAQAYVAARKDSQSGHSRYGSTDMCGRCGNAVYFAEKIMGGGNPYHKSCFSCLLCNKKLDSNNVKDREGEVYCSSCYGRNFGPKGVGYGIGAGTLQTN